MLQGMLLAIVIVALAQLPWLVWLWVRERPQPGGGGGGTKRDEIPPQPPHQPDFDWSRIRALPEVSGLGLRDDAQVELLVVQRDAAAVDQTRDDPGFERPDHRRAGDRRQTRTRTPPMTRGPTPLGAGGRAHGAPSRPRPGRPSR